MKASGAVIPAGVALTAAGLVVAWSGFTGQNPIEEIGKVLRDGKPDGRPPPERFTPDDPPAAPANGASADPSAVGVVGQKQPGGWPARGYTDLVEIGQGGHKLRQGAANAFKNAERIFGRQIPITDSTRDYATQARQYAANPRRFANPDKSGHVAGRAIDVNLPALGIRHTSDASYIKLAQALESTGWCNWQRKSGDNGGKISEPWHFSYDGCV